MADFRRCIFTLATIALLLGVAGTASAQTPLSCFASAAATPLLRAEGITELTGDVVLNCTGGIPTGAGTPVPQVNIQVFLNTSVTSRILSTTGAAGLGWSEAVLLIDEPLPAAQLACGAATAPESVTGSGICPVTGTGGAGTYSGAAGRPNMFQGQIVGNSVLFLGVPVDPPGTTANRIIRITNIRANANALGVASGNAPPTPVIATISTSPSSALPVNNPQQIVGYTQKSLTVSFRAAVGGSAQTTPFGFQQCITRSRAQGIVGALRFEELFAQAFKERYQFNPQNVLTGTGSLQSAIVSESGFFTSTTSGGGSLGPFDRGSSTPAGLANFATRFRAVFNNIPAGVSIYVDPVACITTAGVPVAPVGGACTGTNIQVATLTSSETGALGAVAGDTANLGGQAQLTITGTPGTATAVWEVVTAALPALSGTVLDKVDFGVNASFTASPGTNSPGLGTITVNGSYAPVSTATTATTGPIPRFADTSTASNAAQISVCATNLLFPFVTSQRGFDTGMAISATATDPFGTSAQSGTCTLNFFGDNAPAAFTTPNIPSGTSYANTAFTLAPNFQGYVIAVCRFQYAHGFAFVTKLGAVDLAMGYLALIIPDLGSTGGARGANGFDKAGTGAGEMLGE